MMREAFALGYRRYEWKCDALNAPSRAAAERLGFTFEGIFRQATIYKGRSRDTAWYSILDHEFPALERAFGDWLAPANFDDAGPQRRRLPDLDRRRTRCGPLIAARSARACHEVSSPISRRWPRYAIAAMHRRVMWVWMTVASAGARRRAGLRAGLGGAGRDDEFGPADDDRRADA